MKATEYECKKCGHKWVSLLERKPKTCPRCKAYAWNEERKRK